MNHSCNLGRQTTCCRRGCTLGSKDPHRFLVWKQTRGAMWRVPGSSDSRDENYYYFKQLLELGIYQDSTMVPTVSCRYHLLWKGWINLRLSMKTFVHILLGGSRLPFTTYPSEKWTGDRVCVMSRDGRRHQSVKENMWSPSLPVKAHEML